MNTLPSLWQLLIPNFNGFTILGIISIIIGIFLFRSKKLFKKIAPQSNPQTLSLFFFLGGIILIWAFSILEDLIRSQYGGLIIGGSIVLGFMYYILFVNKK